MVEMNIFARKCNLFIGATFFTLNKLVDNNVKVWNLIMGRRFTIVIDDVLDKKLRIIQAKRIAKSLHHVSFSKILNDELRKTLNKL